MGSASHQHPTPISAAVICFNERQHIGHCLQSLQWCDEIVVVDSGSDDGTQSIVERFPKTKLFEREFDSFIHQKNFALAQCTNRWVISIDADERVTPELQAEIATLAFQNAAYRIRRRTFLGRREIRFGNWNPDYATRLIDRTKCEWGGTNPHESIITQGQISRLSSAMLHYSYDSREAFVVRNRRYALQVAEFHRHSGRFSSHLNAWLHGIANYSKALGLRMGFLDGSDGVFSGLAWSTCFLPQASGDGENRKTS